MDTEIFKTLKSSFLYSSNQSDSSLVELCVTELSSGNFIKAVDLSEELIKKDSNNSVGWALKAMAQAYLFDYEEFLHYLKSSFSSLDEFQMKTPLEKSKVIEVESLFIITLLERTIQMVTERVELVEKLKQESIQQKEYAKAANTGAVLSAFAGLQSKSNVSRILGFSGAIAGVGASIHFENKSKLLEDASKGVFGVAIANIAFTVSSAKKLKDYLKHLSENIKYEATIILQNWIQALMFLYRRLIQDLYYKSLVILDFNPAKNPSMLVSSSNKLIKSNEFIQFKFLSEILEVDIYNDFYKDSMEGLSYIQNLTQKQIADINNEFNKSLLFVLIPVSIWILLSFVIDSSHLDLIQPYFFLITSLTLVLVITTNTFQYGSKSKKLINKKKQYLNGLKKLINYVSNSSKDIESKWLKIN